MFAYGSFDMMIKNLNAIITGPYELLWNRSRYQNKITLDQFREVVGETEPARVLLKLDVMKLNMMFSMNEIHDMDKQHLHNVIASLWFFVQHSVDVSRLICWCVSAFGYA